LGYDGTGNYTRTHNFSADASAGIKILAARMDAEFNDFASAMNLALLADGRNAATGNLPMGGFRHVGVGAPASATNYIRAKDFIENVPVYMVDAESSADRISVSASFYTTASAATAPRDGSHLIIKAGSDKSSAVAIRLNTGDGSPHSAAVILANGSALYSGAIRSGGIYEFIWSSSDTAWQLFNPQVDYATSAYPGVILLATGAEVAAGTDVPKAVTPSQLASKFSASYATETSAGLIELATTAEGLAGTNISVAITPAILDAVVSTAITPYLSASAGGPGVIEIATTAEVLSANDTTRAITPAAARAIGPAVLVARFDTATCSTVSKNAVAASWSLEFSGNSFRLNYDQAYTSAHAVTVHIQTETSVIPLIPRITIAQTSGAYFLLYNRSGSSNITDPVSAWINVIAHRIF
jgi:hypothetical protein